MSDIVPRLYNTKGDDIASVAVDAMEDAAAEITALRARVAELEGALTECANQHRALRSEALRLEGRGISIDFVLAQTDVAIRRARAALRTGE